jgi:hypothetical protein
VHIEVSGHMRQITYQLLVKMLSSKVYGTRQDMKVLESV